MPRILLIADIHSNWPALDAIREEFDVCFFLGDLVDYGTNPVPCVDWIRQHATVAVRGNHDHAVAQRIPARRGPGYRGLAAATRPLHWDVLRSSHLKYLARLPVKLRTTVGGISFQLLHATPRDPMDEYLTADPDAWRARLRNVSADFVCVGHSHIPFHLDLGDVQVVNPGSVGQPRDGDPRASYAVIEDGRVEFHRVPYDIDAAIAHMEESGIEPWAVRLAALSLRSGGQTGSDRSDETDAGNPQAGSDAVGNGSTDHSGDVARTGDVDTDTDEAAPPASGAG